jgi:hypothetical protein
MKNYTREKWSDKSMKSINIHGKEYYEVKERVQEFHRRYPDGSIETEIIELTETRFITKTIVKPKADINIVYTGIACETIGTGGFSGSELECCETSSVGRALGFLNIGITNSIASADEVRNAKENNPASEKQLKFLENLCKKKGRDYSKIPNLDNLSSAEATNWIDKLKKMENK